jgi:hypothetical protein
MMEFGDYERLPEVIRRQYSPEQYAWLSDEDKRRLVEMETEPEYE